MSREELFRIRGECRMHRPALIVAWRNDIGRVAGGSVGSLGREIALETIGEISIQDFFRFTGVNIKEDVIQFPRNRFYSCHAANILIFEGDIPESEPYDYCNAILDFAVGHCGAEEVWTIGGFVSAVNHLSPRGVFGTVNRPDLKMMLAQLDIDTEVDYNTPPQGPRPSLNHFLLWIAGRREIPAYSLWVEVPFYLAGIRDPLASRSILEIMDRRFALGLTFEDINFRVQKIEEGIEELRNLDPDINRYFELLGRGISLSPEEGEAMVAEVARFFERGD